MKISKTAFKEYIRCDRIYPLENIYLKKLDNNLSYFDEENVLEILSSMFDEETGEDLIINDNKTLEAMLEFYQDVEKYAIQIASNVFGIKIEYYKETKKQKSFTFKDESNHSFYCYLDGYLEKEDEVIVIEVKATTSKKYKKAGTNNKPLFFEDGNFLILNDIITGSDKRFVNQYEKLFDPLSDTGKYVFDLAVERYIIEKSLMQKNPELLKKKFKYYLAVLNSDYIFNGKYENGMPVYSNDLINFIDLTSVTSLYLPKIDEMKNEVVSRIDAKALPKEVFGKKCGFNTQNQCIFFDICFPKLKEKGNITEYMQTRKFGPDKLSKEDLINKGKFMLTDIERSWLTNKNNLIQRDSFENNTVHINKHKIKAGIEKLEYPIYHLDFETFPCPLPRFKGERPYTQSLFQFSVHIETSPGKCNFNKDNYSYLVNDYNDNRRELVEELIKVVDLSKGGTVLVYNQRFEEGRLKELVTLFPEYKNELEKIIDSLFDLMDIVKTNSKLYLSLGFDEDESKEVNYYHSDLTGKYSIKKVLPLFSNLNYAELNVKNGTEAIVSYVKFKYLDQEEIEEIRQDLLEYCKLDTWAMVVILDKLRKLSK